MRHIAKGAAPEILDGEGAQFEAAALEFALEGETTNDDFAADLKKFAVFDGDDFTNYGSGLFAKRNYYSNPTVKRQLIAEHFGKCAFCESVIVTTDVGDVEHFRPKAEVTARHRDNPNIEVTVAGHPGYFWLSASWANLYLSCKQCNQANKRNFFDLWPGSDRMTPAALDVAEVPLLLSPAIADDELRRLIRYNPANAEAMLNPTGTFGAIPNQANNLVRITRTIEIAGLNRPRLREARANHLVKLRSLFVHVANGGGLPPEHGPPRVTDARPAILDFMVPAESAAHDARLALTRAVAPSAEFSALALDALIVWSAALRFQEVPAPVALQQNNVIRLQVEPQRLTPPVVLAEQLRAANAASSEAEAEADISDLDPRYNELLRRYKAAMAPIGRDRVALNQRRQNANAARLEYQRLRAASGLVRVEEQYQLAVGRRDWLLFQAGGVPERAAQPEFGQVLLTIANMERQMREPPVSQWIAEDNTRRTQLEAFEAPLEAHSAVLNDINEDLVDLQEAYRVRGTPRAARGARCELFAAALASATAWLDDGTAPSEEVRAHLNGRGFPPGIRR
jgi:5-methylcytosine-specific restriction endonuclease McrA